MPLADPQFWIVSAAALWGFWILLRQLRPAGPEPACGACASGKAACAKHAGDGGPGDSGDPGGSPGLVQIGGGRSPRVRQGPAQPSR